MFTIAASTDGSLAGWSGPAVEQVFWWAVGIVVFGPLVLGIPVLVVSLVIWRLLTRALGHSRRSAFLVAAIGVLLAVTFIPRADMQSDRPVCRGACFHLRRCGSDAARADERSRFPTPGGAVVSAPVRYWWS